MKTIRVEQIAVGGPGYVDITLEVPTGLDALNRIGFLWYRWRKVGQRAANRAGEIVHQLNGLREDTRSRLLQRELQTQLRLSRHAQGRYGFYNTVFWAERAKLLPYAVGSGRSPWANAPYPLTFDVQHSKAQPLDSQWMAEAFGGAQSPCGNCGHPYCGYCA